ncbi:MAG TPA: AraC family transcriptional regulator [Burkholderiaceae bacterium]
MGPESTSAFWRDAALPYLEARSVAGACGVGYARHTHDTFSIGAVTGGQSTYWNGRRQEDIAAGTVVVINPEEAHACNPQAGVPWSYRMLYVDPQWLAVLQREGEAGEFQPFEAMSATRLFGRFNRLFDILQDAGAEPLHKQSAAVAFFSALQGELGTLGKQARETGGKLARAADYLEAHYARTVKLEELCAAAGLSEAHLIRAFKRRFGMTPHAYLLDVRIKRGKARLRSGAAIADVAQEVGFADQAHFQRAFKRHVAATPGQYRR